MTRYIHVGKRFKINGCACSDFVLIGTNEEISTEIGIFTKRKKFIYLVA